MRAQLYTAAPQGRLTTSFSQVAPIRGIDGTIPIYNMPIDSALALFNMIPARNGIETRDGWRVWAEDIGGTGVRSIVPFTGQIGDFTTSRLFAASNLGIYDVTSQGEINPLPVVSFPSSVNDAGFISSVHFVKPTGGQVLLVADGENGYYTYEPSGSIWTKITTEVTGVDPTKIAFVTIHKGRVWFIEKDSSDAWYLPVGAYLGAATKFQFGSKMKKGGLLVGIFSWSADGGDGLDDYLIAVSSGGDLLVYRGNDPAFADSWDLVGSWFIGPTPSGRRIAEEIGGDLVLLSTYGATSINSLMQGIDPSRVIHNVTGKISRLIRSAMNEKRGLPYWEVQLLPEKGLFVANSPREENERHIQFVLNLNQVSEESGSGWGLWRDVPAITFETYDGNVYFGTEDGRVGIMQGSIDGVDINGVGGLPVTFAGVGPFTDLGAPGEYKQVHFCRTHLLTSSVVRITCVPIYDYQLLAGALVPGPASSAGSLWDSAIWDQFIWSGQFSISQVGGGVGYGTVVAFAFEGETNAKATLANTDGDWEPWAFL